MFEVDRYLGKKFHLRDYNCWHFVRDVWFELTGDMLYDYTPDKLNRHELDLAAEDATHRFVALERPVSHTIVLMKRARDTPHIGVMYKGKVLHLRPEGAMYQPLDVASVGFSKILFYTTRKP